MSRMWRQLWHYSGRHRYIMLALPAVLLLHVALDVYIPYLIGDMMNSEVFTEDAAVILSQGLRLALVGAAMMLTGLTLSRLIAVWSGGVTENLRNALFARVHQLALADTDAYGTATILTRLSTDMNYIRKGLGMCHSLLRSPLMVTITVLVTVTVYPQVAWIFLLGAGGLALVGTLVVRFTLRHYRRMFLCYDGLNELLEENIAGQKTVKAFAREAEAEAQFRQRAASLRRETMLAQGGAMLNEPMLNTVMYACILLIVLVCARSIVAEDMLEGDFFCLIVYASQILYQIAMLTLIMVPILNAGVAMNLVLGIINLAPSMAEGAEDSDVWGDYSLSLREVSLSYHAAGSSTPPGEGGFALQGINLDIPPGEFVGIIGASGAGKTSLVSLLLRLYDATSGQILLGGRELRSFSLASLRRLIGFVPQRSLLFTGTIADNLRWGNEHATAEEIVRATALAGANDFIMQLPQGYETQLSQGGLTLSGGQRQRLCIARALIKRPKLLILDDSLSALDNATEAAVVQSLRELEGTTVLLVSQRISSVRRADRILVLDEGRAEGLGTHEELLASSRIYREIYETQRRTMA